MNLYLFDKRTFSRTQGFTLVEILIALVLAAFVIGGVAQVFLSGKAAFNEMQRFAQLQGEMRFLSDFLTRDIRAAQAVSWDEALETLTVIRTAGSNGDRDCLGYAPNGSDEIVNVYSLQNSALRCGGEDIVGGTNSTLSVESIVFHPVVLDPVGGSLVTDEWTSVGLDDVLGIRVSVSMDGGAPDPLDFSFVVGMRNAILRAYNNANDNNDENDG
ncbi:MAG: prepilin-type N-terminal cleavage/methylation domain-containing protein [Pirellulaceae bacterium]